MIPQRFFHDILSSSDRILKEGVSPTHFCKVLLSRIIYFLENDVAWVLGILKQNTIQYIVLKNSVRNSFFSLAADKMLYLIWLRGENSKQHSRSIGKK